MSGSCAVSEKSHLGLEHALGGRVPVGVYSANKVYKGYEGEGSDVIVLNIPGLSHPVGRNDYDLGSPESNELLPSSRIGYLLTMGSRRLFLSMWDQAWVFLSLYFFFLL